MVDTTTLNESVRTPIDGTEHVRLATTGANWRATLANIISALGVPKTGGTMTGNLIIEKTGPAIILDQEDVAGGSFINNFVGNMPRFRMWFSDGAAEGGSNSGSNFLLRSYTDAGATLRDQLSINRQSGLMTLGGDLAISKANPQISLGMSASGQVARLVSYQGANARWVVDLGDATAEGGSNTGSNLQIVSCNDAGAVLDTPIYITRSTGLATLKGDPTAALGAATKQYVDAQRPRGFFAHKNGTNQTGIASTGYTKLTATTERFDHGGWYDAANSKWTPAAGIVFVAVAMVGNGNYNAGSGVLCTEVFKNGSRLFQSSAYAAVTGTQDISTNVGGFDVADGDDYYEWYTYPVLASGTLYCHGTPEISFFTGAWLGATP